MYYNLAQTVAYFAATLFQQQGLGNTYTVNKIVNVSCGYKFHQLTYEQHFPCQNDHLPRDLYNDVTRQERT